MTTRFHRRTSGIRRTPRRHYRPLVEQLESRELLAFDMTISASPTVHVTKSTNPIVDVTTFTANASGANVSVTDITTELTGGNDVVISSGSAGTEPGNISTSGITSTTFLNASRTTLTIRSGSGSGLVGDMTLAGLRLSNPG